jgi:quercetin dioxygenase-like cupin family protein
MANVSWLRENLDMRHPGTIIAITCVLICGAAFLSAQTKGQKEGLKPFIISFKDAEKELRLLSGPPQTKGYRSGFVILQKGQSMHEHSTERYEETLVILAGEGEALFSGHPAIALKEGCLLYVPPDTRHSVKNVGEGPLKYIYLVAPTRSAAQ